SCNITSFNASTGSPNLILLAIAVIGDTVQSAPVFDTTTPQPFTLLASFSAEGGGFLSVYQLGPSITDGTASITISLSGTTTGCISGAVAFSGVASVGTPVTKSCLAGCTTSASVTGITSPGAGGVVFDALGAGYPSTATPAATMVKEWECSSGSTCVNSILGAGGVSGPATSASWTLSSAPTAWAMIAVPLVPSSTTAVKVNSLTATRYGDSNLIELKTGHEVSSLGFNLYREQNGKRVKLNPSLLAGTALLAGPKTTFTAGHSHAWLDKPPAGSEETYWVEEVDLSGDITMLGPVFPEPSAETNSAALSPLIAEPERSALKPQMLSELGRSPALAPEGGVHSCGPVDSGSRPF